MELQKINLSIIIPIYNEEKTILELLKKIVILEKKCELEIIIVNDGSSDKSKQIIENNKKFYSKFVNLKKNRGKGKAIIEGLKKSSGDYVIIQDADLEYDPKDIILFLDKVKSFNYDLVMGSRFIGTQRSVLHFWHMIGNKFITLLFNFLNNTTFTDIYCCYCMFKRGLIDANNLKAFGWGQQAEILTYAINKNSKLFEIAVNYNARNYEDGKKIRYYDVFSVIYWIIFTKLKKYFL